MTTLLDPSSASRLAKLCGMFGSTHEGERAVAAAKADALVRALGLTWHDVIAVPTPATPIVMQWTSSAPSPRADWQRVAAFCQARFAQLSSREREFVRSMHVWRGEPTEKQWTWLTNIYARLHCGVG